MQFLIYLAVMIVLMLVAELTRPVPKGPKRPGLNDFTFPTADPTRKVPVVWGKPVLRGPNVTWYGDFRTEKIIQKIKGMFTTKKQTVGWRFFCGMHLAFCASTGRDRPRLLKIEVGQEVMWTGNLAGGRGSIDKGSVWGGDEGEGGISGQFDWCSGGSSQTQNDYLRSKMSSRAPAYRSTARLVWRGGYLGNSKYVKEWAVQVQRLPTLLGSGYHDIGGEANPAEMLYELLVEPTWGLGATALDIDTDSFLGPAKTLYDEKFGLSMVWDGSKSLQEMSRDILSHIDATLTVNVKIGKWQLRLHRALTEAQQAALLELNEDDVQVDSYARPTLDEVANEVNVLWTQDGETTKWPAKWQDLGLFQVHDKQFISTDIAYPGITSYELAARAATRDGLQLSYPLVKVSLKGNRKAGALVPGEYFKFSYAPLQISGMVCLVIGIDYGTLDDNVVSVEAVQDFRSLGLALYSAGGGTGWVPPSRTPLPPTLYRMEFAPYWSLSVDEDVPDPESAVPVLMVEPPSPAHQSYDVTYNDPTLGASFAVSETTQPFTPTAVLAYDYLETPGNDTSGTLIVNELVGTAELLGEAATDIQFLGQGLIVIDAEWMAVTAVVEREDGSYLLSVQRGLLDSVITRHLAGAKVWFVGKGLGRTPTQLSPFLSGAYKARLISVAVGGKLLEAAAPIAQITTNGVDVNVRPRWAYPVRSLTVNGSKTPAVLPNTDLVVAWKNRNRQAENFIYFQDQAESLVGENTEFKRVYLYADDGALLAQSGDLGPGAETYTFSTLSLPGGLPASGYVQVAAFLPGRGAGQRATLWFGRSVDYSGIADSAPQRLLDEADPWFFWRMSD